MDSASSAGPPAQPAEQPGPGTRPAVWRSADFRFLWFGQTISQFGSQVTVVVVPLIAVVSLHATIVEMGYLSTAVRLPFLLYLVAGVWVDRARKRPLLIGTDLGRGLLLLLIPAAALVHLLSFGLLVGVIFAVMVIGVWFDIAYLSYMPVLVERDDLTAANTITETSNSVAQVAGNGSGGFLVQLLTAPVAILADSLSYFISAALVWRIGRPEPAPASERDALTIRAAGRSIAAGVRYVRRHRILSALALAIGINNVFWAAEMAQYVFFLDRNLGLGAGFIGLTFAAGGPGAVVGSALAGRAQRALGVSGAIIGGLATFAVAALAIPLVPENKAVAVPILIAADFLMMAGGQVCSINVITSRQTMVPADLLGRVNAGFRFMALGTAPFGSLLGSLLGGTLGARDGILAAVVGMFIAPLLLWLSPVRKLRALPARDEGEAIA